MPGFHLGALRLLAADTHELIAHVVPVVGGFDVRLGVGEVP